MSLAAHMLGAHDPRRRYLTGLGAYNPRQRYLSAYNPRVRYLSNLMDAGRRHGISGLGCDAGLGCRRCVSPLGQDIDTSEIDPGQSLIPIDTSTFSTTEIAPGTTLVSPPANYSSLTTGPGYTAIPGQSNASPLIPIVQAAAGAAPAIAYATGKSPYPSALPGGIVGTKAAPGTIAGIPSQYLIYGGVALLLVTALGASRR
jgi:hypothetical protein